jgi:hypothetical protein
LESRAWKRYGRLDRLSNERNWYRDQYDALDALAEALRTDNGLLEYRLQVMRDLFLDQGAQAVEDASTVERVTTAPRKAHEDLVAMRTWRRSGRRRWPRLVPSSNRTVPPSRGAVLAEPGRGEG